MLKSDKFADLASFGIGISCVRERKDENNVPFSMRTCFQREKFCEIEKFGAPEKSSKSLANFSFGGKV